MLIDLSVDELTWLAGLIRESAGVTVPSSTSRPELAERLRAAAVRAARARQASDDLHRRFETYYARRDSANA